MPPNGPRRSGSPERQGTATLLRISAVVVLTMFYTLGAISLYVRARFLKPTLTPASTAMMPSLTWTPLPTRTPAPPTATPTVTPTLYPTMTPKVPPTPKG